MTYEMAEVLTMDLLVWVSVVGLGMTFVIYWLFKP